MMMMMALWMSLLLTFCGVLHGQELQPPTLQRCCEDGRERGLAGPDCTIIPLISSSHTCRVAQEQCCEAAVEGRLCENGVVMARQQGACERPFFQGEPWETKISKMCCDCCMLGLAVAGQETSRALEGLKFRHKCERTALTCSGQNATGDGNSPVGDPVTETPVDGTPCKDSVCSQLCAGNGTCACQDGYTLQTDGVNCEDVNECLIGLHNCVLGQVCINTEGSFRCQRETSCGTGYELKDNNKCQDIDECTLGTHNCGPNFTCSNTEGSFRCHPRERCSEGFIQDAVGSCIDINECVANTSPCLPGQTCINTIGSYTCRRNTVTCGRGYHLTTDGTRCEDVDECRSGTACVGHGCVNLLGSYRCECRIGYMFNTIVKQCEDINECRHYPGRLCAHKCDNTEGSYLCSCSTGFRLAHDGRNCEDVNECDANPCSQECANVYGSYQCYCRRGYQLSDIDGITCEDIDECALPTGGHVCAYRCANTPGSFYCTCPAIGYALATNGRSCQDVDECATGTHACSPTENCFNVQGGYRCLSYACPPNFHPASQGRCERVPCEFTRDPASCRSLPLRISFYNVTFPAGAPVPADVFRMGPSNSVPGDVMRLALVGGDEEGYFAVQQQAYGGVISLRRSVSEPRDFHLTVETRLIRYGTSHLYVAKIAVFVTHEHRVRPSGTAPSKEVSVSMRCIKACQPNDIDCSVDPVHLITHTVLSLPTFRDLIEPEEIVFLRTVAPANPIPGPDTTDVFFDIPAVDAQLAFDVVKRSHLGMIMGVVRQVRPIIGPRDLMLEVSMNYVKSGVISHRNIVVIHIFISEYWF